MGLEPDENEVLSITYCFLQEYFSKLKLWKMMNIASCFIKEKWYSTSLPIYDENNYDMVSIEHFWFHGSWEYFSAWVEGDLTSNSSCYSSKSDYSKSNRDIC
jgi:hypothetical protein